MATTTFLALALAMSALCISGSAANAWTHPTGRRSGAARLLGIGDEPQGPQGPQGALARDVEAWDADTESDGAAGSGPAGRRGGWQMSPMDADALVAGLAGLAGTTRGGGGPSPHRVASASPSQPWPWPQPGPVAQAQQEQQLVDAVGGLGKRGVDEDAFSASSTASSSTRSTAPSPAIFTALGSVGVLSDLSSFFSNLQDNIESMENMTPEERRMVLGSGDSQQLLPQAGSRRPMSAPGLVTSLRNHRPSYKTRHFVETSEPAALRRSNNHDPGLLWTGLGR